MSDDDDRELFEAALESIAPGDLYRGKYGDESADDGQAASQDAASPEELQRLREALEMERAFVGVEQIQRGKYHVAAPQDEALDADELRAEFEAAMNPIASSPDAAPEPATGRSLAQLASDDVHTLNLRACEIDHALGQLGLFVDLAYKDARDLVRVRVGSNPALLAALEEWFRTSGLSYVDEMEIAQAHGDAAIFARIRRTNQC